MNNELNDYMEKENKLAYLIDMDGTLYKGASPIEHAKEFIQYLQQNNRKFLMVTNCPGSTSGKLAEKLARMDIQVDQGNILTSGQVTAAYISEHLKGSRVYLIGSNALEEELLKAGIQIVTDQPDCVVVGFDRHFHYEKMEKAVQYILNGANFIVTNRDYTVPEGDRTIPHTGALASGIEKATRVKPLDMGKPEKYLLTAAQEILNCGLEECCMIGDRLDTDIAMGDKLGITTYLVMTGVTTYELLEKSEVKPTRVFQNLHEVMLFDSAHTGNRVMKVKI